MQCQKYAAGNAAPPSFKCKVPGREALHGRQAGALTCRYACALPCSTEKAGCPLLAATPAPLPTAAASRRVSSLALAGPVVRVNVPRPPAGFAPPGWAPGAMDFTTRMYRIRKTCLEMLADRGYLITDVRLARGRGAPPAAAVGGLGCSRTQPHCGCTPDNTAPPLCCCGCAIAASLSSMPLMRPGRGVGCAGLQLHRASRPRPFPPAASCRRRRRRRASSLWTSLGRMCGGRTSPSWPPKWCARLCSVGMPGSAAGACGGGMRAAAGT